MLVSSAQAAHVREINKDVKATADCVCYICRFPFYSVLIIFPNFNLAFHAIEQQHHCHYKPNPKIENA